MREIRHEPDARRFVSGHGAAMAVLEYRELDGRILDFHHTFVPAPLRGAGLASQLTAHALQFARANGYKVVATCPFVAAFMRRHPDFDDVLAPSRPRCSN